MPPFSLHDHHALGGRPPVHVSPHRLHRPFPSTIIIKLNYTYISRGYHALICVLLLNAASFDHILYLLL